MSVLKAAVKRLFLFVPNSFPIYAVDFLSNRFIIKELCRVVKCAFKHLSTLMCVPQQVVNGLNRIECQDWNFYEYCNPICHGSIPQAG